MVMGELLKSVLVHLTETIFEGQRFNAQLFHSLELLLVEELQLVHGEIAVAVQVHAAKPVIPRHNLS